MFSVLSKSFSVTFSAAKTTAYIASRSISSHTWKGKAPYKSGSPDQQKCIDVTFDAARVLGFDAIGAVEGEIAGGFHNHSKNGSKWITVQYKDANGKILYHKKQDGTIWDRIHLYEDPAINQTATEKPVAIWAQ